MSSPPKRIEVRVENAASMSPGDTRAFSYERRGRRERGFLLRLDEGFVAFCNSCPHWSVDLDLGDERFFDERIHAIVCRNHGAIFDPRTGQCKHGPCRGAYLERFELEVGEAFVSVFVEEFSLILA